MYFNNNTENIHESILASCANPVVFRPISIKINDKINYCIDGGARKALIVSSAINALKEIAKQNGDEDSEFHLYIITLFPLKFDENISKEVTSMPAILQKSTSFLTNEVIRSSLARVIRKNREIKRNIVDNSYKYMHLHILEIPHYEIKGMGFNKKTINELFELGNTEAENKMKNME